MARRQSLAQGSTVCASVAYRTFSVVSQQNMRPTTIVWWSHHEKRFCNLPDQSLLTFTHSNPAALAMAASSLAFRRSSCKSLAPKLSGSKSLSFQRIFSVHEQFSRERSRGGNTAARRRRGAGEALQTCASATVQHCS